MHHGPARTGSPSVSVLMLTAGSRANDGREPSIRFMRALDTLHRASEGVALEVIAVIGPEADAGVVDLLGSFTKLPLRVVVDDGPFSFSHRTNLAALCARGTVLLLFNDDVERLDDDGWLRALTELAMTPDVGAVGAKLIYPDGAVQHAGVWIKENGLAGHAGRGVPANAPGPDDIFTRAHEMTAVTGAVLATRAELFDEVGGLSSLFPMNSNDIDYCLKLRTRGYRILWTPAATLIHDESGTRVPGVSDEEIAAWRGRWPSWPEVHWPWADDEGTTLRTEVEPELSGDR